MIAGRHYPPAAMQQLGVGGQASLVLAHVRQQCASVHVTDRVEPSSGHIPGAQLVVDIDRLTWFEPHRVDTDVGGVGSTADRNEQLLRLADALYALPDDTREAVVLKHCRGWTLAEIAAHLGRTPGAVASLLHRGLKQLRELLHEDDRP